MKKILLILALLGSSLLANTLELAGTVISDNRKNMTSRYMGFIKEVRVSEGDMVKKGELLYSIDSKDIDSAKTQAELAISQAMLSYQMNENQYQNARLNLQRHKRLLSKDMVSKFDVENLELSVKNLKAMIKIAKSQVQQARAKLNEVNDNYKYLQIKAPNDGVVVNVNIKAGEMALPGNPAIVLSDLSDLKILTEISESNLKDVKIGTGVKVRVPSIDLQAKGKVSAIIPSSNPMAHTFSIKISFDYKGFTIYPGMYALVSVEK
ncbi:MAG: efflux transporter periplasmic adaptor subunit [Proteobacteria bacterium]|nr:MAG: efflux transporter periplasmic adaptor subunit [Pseudomonadota bacterium]